MFHNKWDIANLSKIGSRLMSIMECFGASRRL